MSTSPSPRRTARPRRRAYHHGDLRNALIAATLELIPGTGVRALSLREVARRAGVSHAASYRHFRDKDSLLAALAKEGFEGLTQALRQAAQSSGPEPISKLEAAGVAYVDFGLRHPHHIHVMFGGVIASFDAHPELKAAARAAREELHAIVADLLRRRVALQTDEEVLEAAAWAIVHGLTVLLVDGQLRARDGSQLSKRVQPALAEAVIRLFCAGLAGGSPG